MTAMARELLAAFEALPVTDKEEVAAEILRRSAQGERLATAAEGAPRWSTRPLLKLRPGSELVSDMLIRERR